MIKVERFVVNARVVESSLIETIVIAGFDHYPTDDELTGCWTKASYDFDKVYFLSVEKQISFLS